MTEQPAPPAIRAVDLRRVYGRGARSVVALDRLSVEFPTGSFTGVMGPSGSGKSTLLHLLAGLDRADGGEVWLGGTELGRLGEGALTRLRRDRIGFVFQSFNLIPSLSARENVMLPALIAGRRPDRDWFDQVVDATGIGPRLRHRPAELSGGQAQRVAVARALLTRPDVVFADEPTGNLDRRSGAEVLDLLRHVVDDFGRTVVMVTHDPASAPWLDRVVVLRDGRLSVSLTGASPADVVSAMLEPDEQDR